MMKLLNLTILALLIPIATQADVTLTETSGAVGIGNDVYTSDGNHGLGVNWIDYDNDGWDDLFLVNGFNSTPHLYHNDGGTFSNADALLPPLPNVEMMGSVFADYDNDGDTDVYIFTDHELGPFAPPEAGPANLLLKNLWVENGNQVIPGQPLFEEVAAQAGLDDLLAAPLPDGPAYRSVTGGWLDYDRDGYVDLYACHWLRGLHGTPGTRDRLYRNKGDGTFEDVTAASGVNSDTDTDTYRTCLAFTGGHMDDDMWPDAYVVNVDAPLPHQRDMILQNQATSPVSGFVDRTLDSPGVGDDAMAGMGVSFADVDLDGDWDVYISDLFSPADPDSIQTGNPFYRHTGVDILYDDNSAAAANLEGRNSWGVNFADLDHDGDEDLYVTTMGPAVGPSSVDILYLNNDGVDFTDISAAAGITSEQRGRGSAVSDFDHDGDLDVAVVNIDGTLELYRNDTPVTGNWLKIALIATESNRDAIGALVKVTVGGKTMMRQISGGNSAHSQDSLTLHFGLDDAVTVDQIQVFWPSGIVNELSNEAANSLIQIIESGAPGITSPVPGATTLSSDSIEFKWSARGVEDITKWSLQMGSTPYNPNIYRSGKLPGNVLSTVVNNLPSDGSPVHVRLKYKPVVGPAQSVEYLYTATGGEGPRIIRPVPGDTLAGSEETFKWRAYGADVTAWKLGVRVNNNLIYTSNVLAADVRSHTVPGLPTDGSDVRVTLSYKIDGVINNKGAQYYTVAIGM